MYPLIRRRDKNTLLPIKIAARIQAIASSLFLIFSFFSRDDNA